MASMAKRKLKRKEEEKGERTAMAQRRRLQLQRHRHTLAQVCKMCTGQRQSALPTSDRTVLAVMTSSFGGNIIVMILPVKGERKKETNISKVTVR